MRRPTKLSYLRKYKNCLTVAQLAEKAGVNIYTLTNIDYGRTDINKVSVRTVKRIADALGCSIEDILEDEINEAN